jgi:hypothetical protein
MTHKHPPESGRFKKLQSGNPRGRPKKIRQPPLSPFDIVLSETVTVLQDGVQRALTVEEAVESRLLQDAFAGKKMAQRKIMKMIEKRNAARIKRDGAFRRNPDIQYRTEFDPRNADTALILLGIAVPEQFETADALTMNLWAVQAALSRWRSRPKPEPDEINSIRSGTRDSEKLRWPGRWDDE